MNQKESVASNLLHLLITFLEVYFGICNFSNRKMVKEGNRSKSESMKKPDIYFKIFRRSDPSTVIMSNSTYLEHIINLLLFPNYETVEQAITLIKNLPVLKHEKSAIFI